MMFNLPMAQKVDEDSEAFPNAQVIHLPCSE
jgi:hypothetical protein